MTKKGRAPRIGFIPSKSTQEAEEKNTRQMKTSISWPKPFLADSAAGS